MLKRTRAQSIGEYVVLLTIVVSVAAMMFPMVKRGTQSLIRAGADQIAGQQNSEQEFNGEGGYTVNQFSNSKGYSQVDTQEFQGTSYSQTAEATNTISNTLTNMGFTKGE